MCNNVEDSCPLNISDWIVIIESEISNNNRQIFISVRSSYVSTVTGVLAIMLMAYSLYTSMYTTTLIYENIYIIPWVNVVINIIISACLVIIICLVIKMLSFDVKKYGDDMRERKKNLECLRNKIISGDINTPNKIHEVYSKC